MNEIIKKRKCSRFCLNIQAMDLYVSPYSRLDLDEDRRKKVINRGGGGEGGDGRRVGGGRGGQGGGGTMSKTPPG